MLGNSSNIFLVGPMGSGKTTLGRQLGRHLDRTFYDSDHELEHRTGARIALIFEIEGEAGFRRREKKLIEELTQLQNIVLATGGGAVLDEDNRRCLKQRGFVVYLRAPVTRLFARTHRDHSRPLLQTENPYSKLEEIVEQRDPLYRQVADLITDTDHRTIRQVVEEITKIWKSP
jgi:shikimate kinase